MGNKTGWRQRDLDMANEALAILDRTGAIILLNRFCYATLGVKRNDLIGKNWFKCYFPADKQESALQQFHLVMEGKASPERLFEHAGITKTATGHSIAWQLTILRDRHNQIEGMLCQGNDVSVQQHIEHNLMLESEEQSALNAILRISLEDLPLRQQFERVLNLLLSLSWLRIEPKGGIFEAKNGENTLTLVAHRGLPPVLQKACARVPFGHCLCGRAASTEEIQYASCLDERHETTYPGIQPHGHYNIPILSRRGLLGVIVLYLEHGHIKQDREVEFLGSVANTLAGMIEHHRTQDALHASVAKLVEAQRVAHLGGWEWDVANDSFILSNETYRLLEMPPQTGKLGLETVLDFAHPDDRASVREAIKQSSSQGSAFNVDFRILLPGGAERIVHGQAEATLDTNGHATWLSGTLQDITQRKQAEEELRQAATVFENTTEGVMITDATSRITAVNKAFTDITGYSMEEAMGNSAAILKSGRHDDQFYAAMWNTIKKSGSWQGELWNRRKNGNIYPEWLNISAVKNEQDSVTHYVGVFSDISEMKESQSRLDHLAHHDPLTNLPNRLLLNAHMEQSLARARRSNNFLAILFLDLDRFKDINDTLGHPIGDLLLQKVAQRLTDCIREEDTVSRLGGDEFAILLEDLQDSRYASDVAQKIIASLAEHFSLGEHEIYVTCSIGISIFPNDGDNIDVLFKNADSALYRAKEQGRNNYQYYTEELSTRAMERLAMENNLRHALERNEMMVYYQPQVDLYSGQIIGMEALLRWKHPEMGLISPTSFIPLAEETGLIIPIGEWVLRTACKRLKAWIDQGLPKIRVAVNLSSRQFNQKNLVEVITGILHETGLEPQYLEIELTESLIMSDAESAIKVLQAIKALGVQFAIDDFGTGYSSLSYLKRFPIDRIKIDQSFVRNITSVPEDAAVSQAIISMSHNLNIKTVAEGVETMEQQEFLRSRQCDEIQGFHFSRPIPEQEMEAMLKAPPIPAHHPFEKAQERTILLVDDEENVLDALVRVLRPKGYRILRASHPGDAFDLLANNQVGVIISDQRMPGMNGIELLKKVRVLYPNTVRIMLTAYADQRTMADAINEGAVYKFIFKPWDFEVLHTAVKEAFRQHEMIAHAPRRITQSSDSD